MSGVDNIANWLRIDDRLTTSGYVTDDAISELAKIGVKIVINLAPDTHERALPAEARKVSQAGMTYVHIPVNFEAPGENDFHRFSVAMREAGSDPVHVHCIANIRVSAFVYRYRRDVLGVDERIARQAMELLWRPGGVWAAFVGDDAAIGLQHRGPL